MAILVGRGSAHRVQKNGVLKHALRKAHVTAAFTLLLAWTVTAAQVRIDASIETGRLRPLHGVNQGPIEAGGVLDLSDRFTELAIPFVRLHDCHWPVPDVVDVHVVFPNFDADPRKPENYDFVRTDEYVKAIHDIGSRIVYRLGESIEHTNPKRHVHPPRDVEKWAAVCRGIIRHYNEGWANGFHYDIPYWEIWNEPENRPQMWTGTDEQYFQLYATTARAIRREFPNVRVGGPAVGNTGVMVDGKYEPSEFSRKFVAFCKAESAPLDFFSWHEYADRPESFFASAKGVRKLLNDAGFVKIESHLNEWNYLPGRDWTPMLKGGQGAMRQAFYERIGGAEGAAFAVKTLLLLQDSSVDVANYYTGTTQGFGLFTPDGVPKKTFYGFKAFHTLMETPRRLKTSADGAAIWAGRSDDGKRIAVLLSNFDSPDESLELVFDHLPWAGPTRCATREVDATHELNVVVTTEFPAGEVRLTKPLPAKTVRLIELSPIESSNP